MKKLKQKFATILMLASIMTQAVLPVVAFAETADKTTMMSGRDEDVTTQESAEEQKKQSATQEAVEEQLQQPDVEIPEDTQKGSADTVTTQETLDNEKNSDLMKWATEITATVVVDGENYNWSNETGPIEIKQSASFQFKYSFKVPNTDGDADVEMSETYTLALPQGLTPPKENKIGELKNGDQVIGSYVIGENGKITISFEEDFIGGENRTFALEFGAEFSKENFGNSDETKVDIPYGEDQTFSFTIKPKEQVYKETDSKTGKLLGKDEKPTDYRPTYAQWTIRVNEKYQSFNKMTIEDEIKVGHKLIMNSIEVFKITKHSDGTETKSKVNLSEGLQNNADDGKIALEFTDVKTTYEIQYKTEITQQPGGTPETTIQNTAKVTFDESDPIELSKDLTAKWGDAVIQKKSLGIDGDGETITWQVLYNLNGEAMGDSLNFTDTLPSELSLIDGSLKVYKAIVDDKGNYIRNGDEIDGIVPETNEHGFSFAINGQSTTPLVFEYETKVALNTNGKLTNTIKDNHGNENTGEQDVNTVPTISKVGSVKTDEQGNYILWTITVNKNKLDLGNDPLIFKDDFSEYIDYLNDPVDVKLQVDDEGPKSINVSVNNGKFEYSVTGPGKHQYTLTYKTYYKGKVPENGIVKNKIAITTAGQESGGKEAPVGIGIGIHKFGEYDKTDKNKDRIKWTIKINENKLFLEKPVVKDVFQSGDMKLPSKDLLFGDKFNFEIKSENGKILVYKDDYIVNRDSSGKGYEIQFKKDINEAYTITYYTNVGAEGSEKINHVTITDNQGLKGEDTATVPALNPGIVKAGKVRVGEDGKKCVDWTITFNTERFLLEKDIELGDLLTPLNSGVEYVKGTFKVMEGDKELVEAKKNWIGIYKGDYRLINFENGNFLLKLLNKTKREVYTVTYTTTYPKEAQNKELNNEATLTFGENGKVSASAIINPREMKIDKEGSVIIPEELTTTPYRIKWTITANNQEDLANRLELSDATITDAIREGQKLIENSFVLEKDGNLVSNPSIIVDGNSFEVKLEDGLHAYKLTFETEIIRYDAELAANGFKNKATLTNQKKSKDSNEAVVKVYPNGNETNAKPTKTGEQDEATDNILWEATVNNGRLPIKEATIKDTLDNNQEYIQESLKVFVEKSKGQWTELEINKHYTVDWLVSGSFSIKTLATAEIEEEEGSVSYPYKLSYETKLKDKVYGSQTVSNTIGLYGKEGRQIDNSEKGETFVEKWYLGGSGSASLANLTIIKADQESPGRKLAGAAFKVTRYNGTTAQDKGTLTTDESGRVHLSATKSGRYVLEEIEAPTDYDKLAAPVYLILSYLEDKTPVAKIVDADWKDTTSTVASVKENSTEVTILNQRSEDAPKVIDIPVRKQWKITDSTHAEEQDVVVHLLANDKPVSSLTLNAENKWQGVFYGRPVLEDDEEITYTINEKSEDRLNGFTYSVTQDENSKQFTITNTQRLKEISIEKKWQDNLPENAPRTPVTIGLFEAEKQVDQVTLSVENNWKTTFKALPTHDKEGNAIAYQVKELTQVPGYYAPVVAGDVENGFTVTNTKVNESVVELTNVLVQKVWVDGNNADNKRPNSVTVQLVKDNVETGQVLQLSSANNWRASFSGLVKYDGLREIVYSVKEVAVPEYVGTTTGDATTGFTITNTLVQTLSGEKIWNDANDEAKLRPSAITIHLQANGATVATQTVHADAAGKWSYQFTQVPKYDAGSNKELVYTVLEDAVANYTPTYDGLNVTNTLVKEEVKPLEPTPKPTPKPDDTKDPSDGSTDSKEDPIIPDEQTKPLQPGEKPEASKPTTTGKKLPQTGEEFNWIWSLIGSLVLVALGGYVVIRRQRMKKESE